MSACTFDIRPRRLAFGLFAGLSSGEWAWSRTMGQFPWQSDSGQTTGQWQKTIIYQYSRVGKLRASQRVIHGGQFAVEHNFYCNFSCAALVKLYNSGL